jgi:hypothetical protein
MRETKLYHVQGQENKGRGDYAQLERPRKQANDLAKFYDIRRETYIQILIVVIPAWKMYQPREPKNWGKWSRT